MIIWLLIGIHSLSQVSFSKQNIRDHRLPYAGQDASFREFRNKKKTFFFGTLKESLQDVGSAWGKWLVHLGMVLSFWLLSWFCQSMLVRVADLIGILPHQEYSGLTFIMGLKFIVSWAVFYFFISEKASHAVTTRKFQENFKKASKGFLVLELPILLVFTLLNIRHHRLRLRSGQLNWWQIFEQGNFVGLAERIEQGGVEINSPIEEFDIQQTPQGIILFSQSQQINTITNKLSRIQGVQDRVQLVGNCNLCLENRPVRDIFRMEHMSRTHTCLIPKDGYCINCLSDQVVRNDLINTRSVCPTCNGVRFPYKLGSQRLGAGSFKALVERIVNDRNV